MDFSEHAKTVFDRIQKIEPLHASKIFGLILLKESDQEIIRLAFTTDSAIQMTINELKAALLSPKPIVPAPVQRTPDLPIQYTPYPPTVHHPISSPAVIHAPSPYWEPLAAPDRQPALQNIDYVPSPYSNSNWEDYRLHNQAQFLSLEEHLDPGNPMAHNILSNNYYYCQDIPQSSPPSSRTGRRSVSLPELPVKACHYFYKGYCKHGTSCRYFHGQSVTDSYYQAPNPNSNELSSEDHVFLPGSLETLEKEIADLLRSRSGQLITISMLPNLYYEDYGKLLQADGYLTESQRHGKAGYSLTKLLSQLKSIHLIDRPHGQHSVILAEDVPRYLECRNERNDLGNVVPGSQQIYLTFPAESTFTEDDVSDYFKQYGPVLEVRIPTQQKRMFGFVTFVHPETVRTILTKGNPHYVCGARVLVKPYRERARGVERKFNEKVDIPAYYPSPYLGIDCSPHSILRVGENSRVLRKPLAEEHNLAFELELRHLSQLQLAPRQFARQPYFGNGTEEIRMPEACIDLREFTSADKLSHPSDALNDGPTIDDKSRQTSNNDSDQDSDKIQLPDSPFASPTVRSCFSTVIY